MKLSDLVSSLQEIFDEFGECEVYIMRSDVLFKRVEKAKEFFDGN